MTLHKYVFLKGDEVIISMYFDDTDSYQAGVISALDDGAKYVEVDENNPADQFWTWDSVTATDPNGETWTVDQNG